MSTDIDQRFHLLLTAVEQTNQNVQQLAARMEQTNQNIKELGHKVDSVARTAQAHSEAIPKGSATRCAADRRSRQATDRQVAALTRDIADYIATSRQDTSALIQDRAAMFEILQGLNEGRSGDAS
ncbi:MAG: hypothetical protein GDA44_05165 [Prochloron sp. SP5CPC1]|nr:hypothetical protein [Candidatus Paraprochloron terpiosi SP5CPC1]